MELGCVLFFDGFCYMKFPEFTFILGAVGGFFTGFLFAQKPLRLTKTHKQSPNNNTKESKST